jgi:hypothetical protein
VRRRPVNAVAATRRRRLIAALEYQPLPRLLRKYAYGCRHRNQEIERRPAKAPGAGNHFVAQLQIAHRIGADIQDDFAVLDMGTRHLGMFIDPDSKIRGQAAIHTPFMNRANKIRPRGKIVHTNPVTKLKQGSDQVRSHPET